MIKNVILSTLAIAVLAGCSGKKDSDKDTSVVEAIPVKIQKLEKENIARTLDYTANLQADEQVYYAPAATGRIEKIYVEVGDRIKKGQLLFGKIYVGFQGIDFFNCNDRWFGSTTESSSCIYFAVFEIFSGHYSVERSQHPGIFFQEVYV